MPSDTPSRRRLLVAASGCLATALAGCSGTDFGGSTTTHDTGTDAGGNYSSTHEYEVRFARSEADDPFVFRDEATARDVMAASADEPHPDRPPTTLFVLDDDDADDLWIETGADELRPFVAATDFESESIVIQQRSIGDCYYRDVTGVEARDDDFRVHYCRWLKEPTTRCEADTDVMVAIVLRIARPYAESPSSTGSSESMVCRGDGPGPDASGNRSTSEGDTR